MKCKNCGTEFDTGIFCPECGTKYEDENIIKESVINEDLTDNGTVEKINAVNEKNNKLETISLIMGILSLVTLGGWIFPGIIAIVCANKSKVNGELPQKARIGKFLGILGYVLYVLVIVIFVTIILIGNSL